MRAGRAVLLLGCSARADACVGAEPNFTCLVEVLPQCCKPGAPPRFPPIRAGDYLLSRYAATHAAYGGKPEATHTDA